eukprot:3168891-Prymnesium_polylepis.1
MHMNAGSTPASVRPLRNPMHLPQSLETRTLVAEVVLSLTALSLTLASGASILTVWSRRRGGSPNAGTPPSVALCGGMPAEARAGATV